uniref:Genes rpmH, rnpA, 50kd, gidA and gidB n=1 Tax=Bacillus subtilis TaxID=1423 RepID=Q45646_BACIU|nr:unnamed protein product [Bacillus subtilis]
MGDNTCNRPLTIHIMPSTFLKSLVPYTKHKKSYCWIYCKQPYITTHTIAILLPTITRK